MQLVLPFGLLVGHCFGLSRSLFDRTNIHERVLWQVIPLTVAQFFEAADGVFERGEFTLFTGKHFCNKERL